MVGWEVVCDDVGHDRHLPDTAVQAHGATDRLAAGGLKYNPFHTTALCAPTRQAMLTDRNHQSDLDMCFRYRAVGSGLALLAAGSARRLTRPAAAGSVTAIVFA